jgi:hypothetical protein
MGDTQTIQYYPVLNVENFAPKAKIIIQILGIYFPWLHLKQQFLNIRIKDIISHFNKYNFDSFKLEPLSKPILNIMVGGKHWAIYMRWNGRAEINHYLNGP